MSIACNIIITLLLFLSRKNKRVLQHRHEVTILAERLVASRKEQRVKEMQSALSGGGDGAKSASAAARPRTTSSAKSN